MNEVLEILVVEDREENRTAAQQFFDTVEGVEVDFAASRILLDEHRESGRSS